jgi:hypothetical protein
MYVCIALHPFSGVSEYGNPVFVLDWRGEKLTEKDVNMVEEVNESMHCDELPPEYSESPECDKEISA